MVTPLEVGLVVLALLAVVLAYKILETAKALAVNAIVGLVVLVVANALGANVVVSPLAVVVCALAGVPGAILVVLLAYLDIAFVGMVAPILV